MPLTEEQLLVHLGADPVPCALLLKELDALCGEGKDARAMEWAELIKSTLVDRKMTQDAVVVYEWLALRRDITPAIAQKELLQILSINRKEQKFIEPSFSKASSIKEAFRRLRHLHSMKKGMLCFNKTWGFGIVKRIDPFYQMVEVEFERTGDHDLAFSYAAEALDLLTDDHLLAIRHNNPEKFAQMIKEEPSEIIRITLHSYGPLSISRIQELFVPDLIATEADWKKFWSAARREFKNDPLISIPSKRTEPLCLHHEVKIYNETWFEDFRKERDITTIFQKLEEVQAQKFKSLQPYMIEAIANRLAFTIKGGALNRPGWTAQALVYSEQIGVEAKEIDSTAELSKLSERSDLSSLLEGLPARFMQAFISRLFRSTKTAKSFFLRRLPEFGTTALNETIHALIHNGAEAELIEQVQNTVRRRVCSPALLLWILRNEEQTGTWNLTGKADLALQTIEVIEEEHGGAALRAQNQLREQIENTKLLKSILIAMNNSQKRDFMRRISESPAWNKLDRQSFQAKIIKLCPDLHEIVLNKIKRTTKETKSRITSHRSYQERKDRFEQIIKKEIPENSKEIELARSYGDLRENAEFKFAKEKQRLLSQQAQELQKALNEVKPTDFKNFRSDTAGIANGVELTYSDGRCETYYILGEWDQDEAFQIISCQAGMAKALEGAKAGDTVKVPTSSGEKTKVKITAVIPLPEHIKAWINGQGL